MTDTTDIIGGALALGVGLAVIDRIRQPRTRYITRRVAPKRKVTSNRKPTRRRIARKSYGLFGRNPFAGY